MKKTRLSGILDNSSVGISLGQAELPISIVEAKKLRREMRKSALFSSSGKDTLEGNIEYVFRIEEGLSILYEFKRMGSNMFLNVTGNPTKLMTGKNSVPVLIKAGEFNGNAILNTFKYAGRVMFAILEYIPGFDFKWQGQERRRITEGDFNISRLQVAWYTGDLGEHRSDVYHHLRLCYGGVNAVDGKARNLAKDLGLSYLAFDHNDNFVLSGTVGDKKEFSLTLYSKDLNDSEESEDKARFSNVIRFDCSFNDYFLRANGIKLVKDLERRYEELCEEGGYDLGFVKWLSKTVYDRLHMEYLVGMTWKTYDDMLKKAEAFVETHESAIKNGKKKKTNAYKLVKDWLDFDNVDLTAKARCERLDIPTQHYSRIADEVRELTGIDVNISQSFIVAMLDNRLRAQRTELERQGDVLPRKSNQRATLDKLRDKDTERTKKVEALLLNGSGLRLRKLKPTILKSNNFYAYSLLREGKKNV